MSPLTTIYDISDVGDALEEVALDEGNIMAIQNVLHLRLDAEDQEGVWELEPDSLESCGSQHVQRSAWLKS